MTRVVELAAAVAGNRTAADAAVRRLMAATGGARRGLTVQVGPSRD